MKGMRSKFALLSLLSVPAVLLVATGGSVAAAAPHSGAQTSAVTTSSLGLSKPTFVGSAATGCTGCHLLTGPFSSPSTAHVTADPALIKQAKASADRVARMPLLRPHVRGQRVSSDNVIIPTVSCVPLRPGCDSINSGAGGSTGVKGIDAVDSAEHTANIFKDVEPPDQGLCAGNGSVIQTNNIGEIQIWNRALTKASPVISLDTVMGLTKKNWSSGGDPSCIYDPSNGGHWFITEIVSASPESKGGAFTGCFGGVANECYEGIAVTKGSSPYGPYNNYFLSADYNPAEPGSPNLLNDYAKISATRDSFMLFYDEFPLLGSNPGLGGGFFNGAQQFAFDKNALEMGMPAASVMVARENMGLLKTPNGTCTSDSRYFQPGVACWFSVIPAQPANGVWDNTHGGSGFMLADLDFYSTGGNQLAVFDWRGLKNLDSSGCSACSGIKFGGQLFSGVHPYFNNSALPSGTNVPQKVGPIPLGNECGAAQLSSLTSCPEYGIATNSDQVTQASQGNGQLWAGVNTLVEQTFGAAPPEQHVGAEYFVVGTSGYDKTGTFTLTNQGYVSAMHEELEFPAMASGASNGQDLMSFTLSGNGGQNGADNGGFYPSSAFGLLTPTSAGLLSSTINIADLGQSPEDGFTEYQGYPGTLRARWGDYGAAVLSGNKYFFSSEYIQSPNCAPPAFTLTIGTCGGTRDGNANWGTSVNSVNP